MYRLSVTTIEKFRRYMTQASSYDTEQSLLDTIRGLFTGNDLTRVGGCFGKIIEGDALIAEGGLITEYDGARIFFTDEQAFPAVEFRRKHPAMIYEVPLYKVYETKFGAVQVSGRLDGAEGLDFNDNKCKFKPPDFTEYGDSYQWRYYLDMGRTSIFYYDIYEVRGFEALRGSQPYRLPGVQFIPHDRLQCARYAGLADDCRLMLQDLLEYIELRQLWPYLKLATPEQLMLS